MLLPSATRVHVCACTCAARVPLSRCVFSPFTPPWQLVPKMGLATAVLRKVYVDLLFFSISFIISMLSFSMMLYVQLGPVMEEYWDQVTLA